MTVLAVWVRYRFGFTGIFTFWFVMVSLDFLALVNKFEIQDWAWSWVEERCRGFALGFQGDFGIGANDAERFYFSISGR